MADVLDRRKKEKKNNKEKNCRDHKLAVRIQFGYILCTIKNK